jgi:hypothetical protein
METQILFLQNRLNQLNYDNNGNPIGIDADEFNAMVEQLEELESQIN